MSENILNLINDIEILLKRDERFYNSNNHLFKNKIKHLAKNKYPSNGPISIPYIYSLKNLSKLTNKKLKNKTSNDTCDKNDIDLTEIIAKIELANEQLQELSSKQSNTINIDLTDIIHKLNETSKQLEELL